MKILVVQPIRGGSVPIAWYCTKALKQLGVDAHLFPGSIFADVYNFMKQKFGNDVPVHIFNPFSQLINSMLHNQIEELKPDVVLGLAQAPLFREILSLCRKKGIVRVFWFIEDCGRFLYWKEVARNYDFFFIIQKEPFMAIIRKLCSNVFYLPLAADPEIHRPAVLSGREKSFFGSDVSFVGAGYPNRIFVFEKLGLKNFKIWGSDWDIPEKSPLKRAIQMDGARVSVEDYVKIFNASKINLNLHSSTDPQAIGMGDFVNPRTFEISACRAFQLVDKRTLLGELYMEDELVTFDSIDDLKNKIGYFLTDELARKEFSVKSYRRTVKDHTYIQRMKKLLKVISRF